jgi:hypothetical protein
MKLSQTLLSELDVTSGNIIQESPWYLSIEDSSVRATTIDNKSMVACLQFRYLGATTEHSKTKSNIELHQIGFKLLSKNSCNVVYVMWQILPKQELVIKVKQNLGQSENSQCGGDRGYHLISRYPLATFGVGETHELLTKIIPLDDGNAKIHIWVDWQEIDPVTIDLALIQSIEGVPGLRAENGRYQIRYFTEQ